VIGTLEVLVGMLSVALRFPDALGVKVTLTEQLLLGATALVQEFTLMEKSLALAPASVGIATVSGALPVFVTV
jgi:hypothetical protein